MSYGHETSLVDRWWYVASINRLFDYGWPLYPRQTRGYSPLCVRESVCVFTTRQYRRAQQRHRRRRLIAVPPNALGADGASSRCDHVITDSQWGEMMIDKVFYGAAALYVKLRAQPTTDLGMADDGPRACRSARRHA